MPTLHLAQLMGPGQQLAMDGHHFAHVLQDKQGQMQWPQMLQCVGREDYIPTPTSTIKRTEHSGAPELGGGSG